MSPWTAQAVKQWSLRLKSMPRAVKEELHDSFCLETSYTEAGMAFSGEDAYGSFLPHYDGSDVTVLDSHLMLFQFAIRHGLSNKGFGELLRIIYLHLRTLREVSIY